MRTYAGHGTDLGLITGLLSFREDDNRIRIARWHASRLGIGVEVKELEGDGHPNEMLCELALKDGSQRTVLVYPLAAGV